MDKVYKINAYGMEIVSRLDYCMSYIRRIGFKSSYDAINRPHLYLSASGKVFFNMTNSQRYRGGKIFRVEVPAKYLIEIGESNSSQIGDCLSTIENMKVPKNDIEIMMDKQIMEFIEEVK